MTMAMRVVASAGQSSTGGGFTFGLIALALGPILSALIVLALGHDRRLEPIPGRQPAAEG